MILNRGAANGSIELFHWKSVAQGDGLDYGPVMDDPIRSRIPERNWWSDVGYRGQPECRAALHVAARIPGHSRGDVAFRAMPPDPSAKALKGMKEKEIVSALLYDETIFHGFFEPIRSHYGPLWAAIELQPRDLGIRNWRGRPGDFDFLFGRLINGQPDFNWFLGAELKISRARADGEGQPAKGGSEQATGLLDLGCDQALLVQLVVLEQTQENAIMHGDGFGTMFGADFSRASTGWVKQAMAKLPDHIGLMHCVWGHPAQNSPLVRSCIFTYAIRRPGPNHRRLHLEWAIANDKLRRGLIELWNRMPESTQAVRRCPLGGHVVPVLNSTHGCCSECGKPWLWGVVIPDAENIVPDPPG